MSASRSLEKLRDEILSGNVETLKDYLKNGGDPNAEVLVPGYGYGFTNPLICFAVKSKNLDSVRLLVEAKARIKSRVESSGANDAILHAVYLQDLPITRYLLEHGADAKGEAIDKNGARLSQGSYSLLVQALDDNNLEIAESLYSHGASILGAIYNLFYRFIEEFGRLKRIQDQLSSSADSKMSDKIANRLNLITINFKSKLQWLCDRFMGNEFTSEKVFLDIMKKIDISDLNFVGVSIQNQPITHKLLADHKLTGNEKTIVTVDDLKKLNDVRRQKFLTEKVTSLMEERGKLINNEGVVNLVHLAIALEENDTEVVKARLSANNANPNKVTKSDRGIKKELIPIIEATRKRNLDLIKFLIAHPRFDRKILPEAIKLADKEKYVDISEYLTLEQDAKQTDNSGNTPLYIAVRNGRIDQINYWLSKNADVNHENDRKVTPLLCAIGNCEIDHESKSYSEAIKIVEKLLENNPNPTHQGRNFIKHLELAVRVGSCKAVELLLSFGNKKNLLQEDQKAQPQKTPWYARLFSNPNPSEPKRELWYANLLFYALSAANDGHEIITLLKKNGADLNVRNSDGDTALHGTIQFFYPRLSTLIFLLEQGADPRITDRKGKTPLKLLIEKRDDISESPDYDRAIRMLLKCGADIDELPLDLRQKFSNSNIGNFKPNDQVKPK